MKILWFSNCSLSGSTSSGSGSWLFAMRDLIADDVEMVNITEGKVEKIEFREGNGIQEYILPAWKLKEGVPSTDNIRKIIEIINKISPDLIHIWGVEKYWALLFSRGHILFDKVLLEMQGVMSACVDVYYGGLTPKEICKQVSLKSTLFSKFRLNTIYQSMQKRAVYEEELIKSFKNIAVQSKWTKEQLYTICNERTKFYNSLRPIRQEFYHADKWSKKVSSNPVVFCSISYYRPFKGLHLLLRAMSIICNRYPSITLRIAGPNLAGRPFYYNSDYERFILQEIKRLKLVDKVHFCGSLDAAQMVEEIQNADVVVNPSLVESYSAAAAEALYIGAPTVLAYAGAMVNFSDVEPIALYYSPMDYRSLAARIITMIEDSVIRETLLANAIIVMHKICSADNVKKRQLENYKLVLSDSL